MIDDLISRKDAIDALEREKTYCTAFREGYTPINVFEKYNAGLTDGIKALKKLPTADVVERKHGKWNWVSFNIECSECGAMPNFDSTEPLYNFCPNCGADMRGEQDAETN